MSDLELLVIITKCNNYANLLMTEQLRCHVIQYMDNKLMNAHLKIRQIPQTKNHKEPLKEATA